MQNIRYLYYLLLVIVLLSASCPKQNPNPAEFYIRCKIDGRDYWPNKCANCMRGQILGDTVFGMNANAGFESLTIGIINKPEFVLNTYLLNRIGSGGSYKYSTTINDRFRTDSSHTGELKITSLDKVNKIIAGTFYFRAYNPVQDKTVNITNGEFRLNYSDY